MAYPYAPYAPYVPPAPAARSGTALTLGILSVVFGSLWVLRHLLDFVAAASFAWLPSMLGSLLGSMYPAGGATDDALHTMALFFVARGGLMVLTSAALLVVGVGLIRQREWGRRGAIVWSCVALVVLAARILTWRLGVLPALADAMNEVLKGIPTTASLPRANPGLGLGSEDVECVVLVAFPVVLLSLLARRSVRDAMKGQQPAWTGVMPR
jgi:hypothetical protein